MSRNALRLLPAMLLGMLGWFAGTPAADAATAAATAAHAPCAAYARACVSLGRQEAWLMSGGRVVYGPVPVATGRRGWATPAGTFHVRSKARNFWSTAYNLPMPYSVFFYKGDAFHVGPLGAGSHGCVHLTSASAARFYGYLNDGDVVQIVWR